MKIKEPQEQGYATAQAVKVWVQFHMGFVVGNVTLVQAFLCHYIFEVCHIFTWELSWLDSPVQWCCWG
jgi:hypothetical protein